MIRPLKGCVLSNWMKTAQTIKLFPSLEGSGFQSLVMRVFMNLRGLPCQLYLEAVLEAQLSSLRVKRVESSSTMQLPPVGT